MSITILTGDCRDVLKTLADGSVQCVVTSPPYFQLRDYGVSGQMGLEATPDGFVSALVEVFREVRRVLRDDGTVWLNLGDSYAGSGRGGNPTREPGTLDGGHASQEASMIRRARGKGEIGASARVAAVTQRGSRLPAGLHEQQRQSGVIGRAWVPPPAGLKQKDLIGIPWRVAFALQQPFYTGSVADERDRIWLAAMVDAEGSICGTEYETNDRTKTNIYISITNTSVPIIDKCERLFPQDVKHVYEKSGPSSRICYRWDVERMETKSLFIREVYPHLVAKRKQAIVGYTFLEMQRGLVSKKKGYLPEQQEKRSWLMSALSRLNAGEDVDLPSWLIEPPSLFEPGYYLRQDIIWSKPNPMPESVTDRCTKAHEYLFLLSKSERYYFDADAIAEPAIGKTPHDLTGAGYAAPGQAPNSGNRKALRSAVESRHRSQIEGGQSMQAEPNGFRNKRSVWTVPTRPYAEAHFATFPPKLIEPCILAGCPKGGVVLDCFGGAGTTGLVADRLGRNATLIELNPEYVEITRNRIKADAGMFGEVA